MILFNLNELDNIDKNIENKEQERELKLLQLFGVRAIDKNLYRVDDLEKFIKSEIAKNKDIRNKKEYMIKLILENKEKYKIAR